MKLIITNNEDKIGIIKDFSDLNPEKNGLIGQLVMELDNLKNELMDIYFEGGTEE